MRWQKNLISPCPGLTSHSGTSSTNKVQVSSLSRHDSSAASLSASARFVSGIPFAHDYLKPSLLTE
jgi:hypothetical protein